VFVDKSEQKYLEKLPAVLRPYAVFVHPVDQDKFRATLLEVV
jgi:hypothetical protein